MSGGLEEETRKRKARLQALRQARQALGSKAENEENSTGNGNPDKPKDEPQQQQPTENKHDTVERLVDGMVETTLAERQETMAANELDITTIAPRRANWDLKRDLQQRLEKLKPRNDAAIADLIRKRIQESGDASDLASAVEANIRSSELQSKDE
ncbi:hypothetical protein IW140_001851 [Coemansia sp. RSA 1813]|nr:hypothetical protein EV178_002517 [Coemansia sp. RSA 1646]KAJ1772409.1 hypothetical protein LPJ74_001499 [Coemansia sp. RSA 1843]KAJ2091131.1 hypothetical protein IW138_002093 [Coemansia sp. RSA 986]KAJ2213616.1 hypothetical protein EV179_003732 [Coemansia sp. RSA 487]KAJ2571148.1 hypothetical protein IW140_001851 [Coemansia sp. RSA 1813]